MNTLRRSVVLEWNVCGSDEHSVVRAATRSSRLPVAVDFESAGVGFVAVQSRHLIG